MQQGMVRERISIAGLVQGVGFRPFVSRLAMEMGLVGLVQNTSDGVLIEVEGKTAPVQEFRRRLQHELPPLAWIAVFKHFRIPVKHETEFVITASVATTKQTEWVMPDMSICDECFDEITEANSRRFHYAFTSCTNCGPRFSIITKLPYDRRQTTMAAFPLCPACETEYHNPADRRFHAQPLACDSCGPRLHLLTNTGKEMQVQDVVGRVAALLAAGKIVGVKGVGGYQLLADATNEDAVQLLRHRKHRPEKPFAVMFPSLAVAQEHLEISAAAKKLLLSKEAPIVILPSKQTLAPGISLENPTIGAFLPYTPLHILIAQTFGKPFICTSGNVSGEPIITDDTEALERLKPLVDYLVTHNRAIAHHGDDSVMVATGQNRIMIRRARGYVPLPIMSPAPLPALVGLGGQQKNTCALSNQDKVFVSQHIGDLDSPTSIDRLIRVRNDLEALFAISPTHVVCDLHPDYESTRMALTETLPVIRVQHHEAHIASCMLDNGYTGNAIGAAWDGTGYGTDGTLWGGEFFATDGIQYHRIGRLRPFALLGGERAISEPKRIGLALLYESFGEESLTLPWTKRHFTDDEVLLYRQMFRKQLQTVTTSSMGRLFDGVAALAGLKDSVSFEGQAAMMLESMSTVKNSNPYSFEITTSDLYEIDWRPLVQEIMADDKNPHLIGSRFHRTVTEMLFSMVQQFNYQTVALSGGCFQNSRLVDEATARLGTAGYSVLTHRQLPPNDGGLSAGQVYAAGRRLTCA